MAGTRRVPPPEPPSVPRNFAITDEAESGPPSWWLAVGEGETVIAKLEHWELEGLSGFEVVFFTQDGSSSRFPPRTVDLQGFDFARAVARGEFLRLEPSPRGRPDDIGGEGH